MRSLRSPRSLGLSLELSTGDVERVAEVEVRLAPGLSIGGARGKYQCASWIFIRPSPEISVGDMGEATGVEMRLAPGLSVRGVGVSVNGSSSTGLSLRLSPELSAGYMETAAVGERLAPGFFARGVGDRVRRVDEPSVRMTL